MFSAINKWGWFLRILVTSKKVFYILCENLRIPKPEFARKYCLNFHNNYYETFQYSFASVCLNF